MPHGAISCHSPPPSSSRTSLDVDEVVFCKSEINYGHVRRSVVPLVVPLDGTPTTPLSSLYSTNTTTTHFSFSRVFFCVSVSTRFSPGANGGGGGGGAFGTSDGSGGGAGTANKRGGAKIEV